MKILIVLNDPPYGTERTYNGLRRHPRPCAGGTPAELLGERA